MKTLAITTWALGVIVLSIFGYLSFFKWRLPDGEPGPKWSTKRKMVELLLLLIGSGLLATGIGIQLFLVAQGNYFN